MVAMEFLSLFNFVQRHINEFPALLKLIQRLIYEFPTFWKFSEAYLGIFKTEVD